MSSPGACPNCGAAVRADQEFCATCGGSLLSDGPAAAVPHGICPRCGVPIGPADPAVACARCGAPHHQGCFAAHGGCAVLGCSANPLTAAPYPALVPYPPAVGPSHNGPNGALIAGAVGGGVLLVALIVAVVLLTSSGGGHSANATTTVVSGSPSITTASSTSAAAGDGAGELVPGGQSTHGAKTPSPPPPLVAPPVTGSDGQYNTGPNCSDNPSSPLPGCADSPSTPNRDPEATCSGGITTDAQTTSCGLAVNVKAAYRRDGTVIARSPERGRDYAFTCQTGGAGTTHMTICHGQAGTAILYLRW